MISLSKCRNSQTPCGQALAARRTNNNVLIHLNHPVQILLQGRNPDQLLWVDTHLDATKRSPYSFNAIIGMAFQSSPHKRLRLQEIYEYIATNFPYYNDEESFGWKSSVRHNLSIQSHFQKVKSEDGTGNYWEMTCDFGTDFFIG
ncbi:hypothetical protein CAEBREN_22004 [Caenorhabditis brenneri]|uniref:Fork-head domain-containing protein n=1 Tax=Caenorhabditis brenneri TaxID=135651 RepID=G0P2J2_CAEBE|nr:hypothetical protein CAEBREN_22004 [Caenorhabditis brenneri]